MIKVGFITNYFIFLFSKSKQPPIRTLKKTVRWVIGIILGIYIGTIILLNIPYIQRNMTTFVTKELSRTLGTELTIGKIDIGLLNRIIIDDVLLDDQSGQEMLKVTRLSAKFDIMPFFKGKISISSVQLFGFNINLRKETPDSPPNFKFVLDAFASKDTVKKENSLDLRINSILIRRGRMSYHVLSEEETPGKFNAKHIQLQNIIANISLKALSKDSLNLGIKRLSLDEKASGFSLKKMSLKLVANNKQTNIDNFTIELPETSLKLDTIHLEYDSLKAFDRFTEQVHFSFRTLPSQVTLKDISPFVPILSHFKEPVTLDMEVKGTVDQLTCSHLEITADDRQEIATLVTDKIVNADVKAFAANKDFLNAFIVALASKWSVDEPIVISTSDAEGLKKYFTAQAKELLDKGVKIEQVNGNKTLFSVSPADGSYKVNFGEEEFMNYFKEFLRPQLVEMLF